MAEIDTILDNQKVTAEILNDIAIDLGYASFSKFDENKFGADKLNEITSALVSSGILSSGDKCEPCISDGKVYIKPGTIVFSNGAKKKITDEDVALDLIPNSYIYALNDTVLNTCKIIVSETAPSEGDFVMIAEISANGSLVDKRTIAKAKVELPTEGNSYSFTETFLLNGEVGQYNGKTLSIPIEGVSKIFIKSSIGSPLCLCYYDVEENSFTGFYYEDYSSKFKDVNKSESISLYNYSGSSQMNVVLSVIEKNDTSVTFKYSIREYNYHNKYEMKVEYSVFGGVER